eukprot:363357-Chlamydomonas_euryale.AAC.5
MASWESSAAWPKTATRYSASGCCCCCCCTGTETDPGTGNSADTSGDDMFLLVVKPRTGRAAPPARESCAQPSTAPISRASNASDSRLHGASLGAGTAAILQQASASIRRLNVDCTTQRPGMHIGGFHARPIFLAIVP